jgi:hypothetical protein
VADAVGADTVGAHTVGADTVRTDTVRTDTVRADTVRTHIVGADTVRAHTVGADTVRAHTVGADTVRAHTVGGLGGRPEPPNFKWTEQVDIRPEAAHVYTECARIWNPIHTDAAVARAAGLPAIILHGTATLALAVSRVVARELDGDAASVRRISARFTGFVRLPSALTVRCRGRAGSAIAFDAVGPDGASVLAEGVLTA